jgi:hypothetical protein
LIKCFEFASTFTSNKAAIAFWVSQTVSFFNMTSTFILRWLFIALHLTITDIDHPADGIGNAADPLEVVFVAGGFEGVSHGLLQFLLTMLSNQ